MSLFGIAGTRSGRIVARTAVVVAALVLSLFAQSALAQTGTPPLKFGNNFLVTGDYVVAGAQGMTTNLSNGYAIGTINVPDKSKNPGLTGATSVPPGAQVVAALLYWETVEKVAQIGSGQVGFFRPKYTGGPAPYQITGTLLNSHSPVAFSSGGCSGTSTGKVLSAYRADVRAYIPQDANGNTIPNSQYEVRLPSTGNNTPLTLGATLVIIYRILSPDIPLNAIVIYDGAYTPTGSSLTMSQTLQGFYQAAANPVSRLTHIVGSGQSNKYQYVYLNGKQLPSLYGSQPTFPGWYDGWDNPTWTLSGNANPVPAGSGSATTMVVPAGSNAGCVAWGAIILSTTVQNSDGDGILDVWKNNPPGYCDAAVNNGVCQAGNTLDPGWVPLPGAAPNQKDVFVQLDFMCGASNGSQCTAGDSFDPRQPVDPFDGNKSAVDKVVAAYANNHVQLHVIPTHAMVEQTCTDPAQGPLQCSYPDQPGVVGWKGGLITLKNQLINPTTGILCSAGDPACVPVFQHGKKDSYHYALFANAVGLPNWTLYSGGGLASVVQSGTKVTITTSSPHHLDGDPNHPNVPLNNLNDTACPLHGRVSVNFATSNSKLNGHYCVQSVGFSDTTFTIQVPFSANTSYTTLTDPNLAVSSGQAGAVSGFSDVGGQDSLITLGNWGADGQTWQTKAGTFMHELGHANTLTHSGFSFKNLTSTNTDYTATLEPNCKPNYQSVMNYLFQVDLLDTGNVVNGNPVMAVDYSGQVLDTLTENSPTSPAFKNIVPSFPITSWYALTSFAGGTPASTHCDGTPLLNDQQTSRLTLPTNLFAWSAATGEDINFDGNSTGIFTGHNDWMSITDGGKVRTPGINLLEVSATGTLSAIGAGGVQPSGGGGGIQAGGGGGGIQAGGGGGGIQPTGGGGGVQPGGGGGGVQPGGGGGGIQPGGGGGGVPEIDHTAANSVTRPPRNLTASEETSPRNIDLTWNPPAFGQIDRYKIYRAPAFSSGSPMTVSVGDPRLRYDSAKNQFTFIDTDASCLSSGRYTYSVTALLALNTNQESVHSNTVIVTGQGDPLTGCYTVSGFSSPASAVHGSIVPITWTLTDDFYTTGNPVNKLAATKTLVAIGPVSADGCVTVTSGRTTLISNGAPTALGGTSTFAVNASGQFTFNWDTDTRPFCAGSYTFELDLDSGQIQTTASALQLAIDVNDTDSTPHIDTISLPDGVVGLAYSNTLSEHGGTAPFAWSVPIGQLPSGLSLNSPSNSTSTTLTGTTCAAGTSNFTVRVTDFRSNSGTQALTLSINKANTTTSVMSNATTSVFQQMVTFTVTVAPQYSCTPTGTVTLLDLGVPIASNLPLSGGMATFTTSALSVGIHSITATYAGDANFNASNSNSAPVAQTVNKASTAITLNSVSPSPVFVNQPVTVSYTFGVVAPGAGSPIPPFGNITVTASDGTNQSSCMAAAALGTGACVLSPAPKAAGNVTFTITYPGDGNFVTSGANGNYNVYQLVFTTQPSNTGVGLTMTPAVQVAAQDANNVTLQSFTGSITLALGSNPGGGTLSGTNPQNATGGVATFADLSIDQMGTGYTLVASLTGVVAATVTSNAFNIDAWLYFVDAPGNFGRLDLTTGVATIIGNGTVLGNTGMDLTPGGQVYAYNTSNQLLQVNTSTGAATLVGTGTIADPGFTTTGGLTNGSYFAIDALSANLYAIDLTSGATALVGATGAAARPAGCGFHTSLSGSATVLYYTVGYSGANCTSPLPDTLYIIDPTSLETTTIGHTSVGGFVGSAYVSGKLYGFTINNQEYLIDVTTGTATLVTNTTTTVFGGASIF